MTHLRLAAVARVIIATPQPARAQQLSSIIVKGGYGLQQCDQLDKVLQRLDNSQLIVLDPDLPPRGGLAACTAVRKISTLPILVAGRQMSEDERIIYLDQGADDVLGWPLPEQETLARVRAHLRRFTMRPPLRQVPLGDGRTLDLDNDAILVGEEAFALTPTEARLIRTLASRLGRPYPVRSLIEAVWGQSYLESAETDILRANVYRLRRKLEIDPRDPKLLRFVPGQGWILGQEAPEDLAAPSGEAETVHAAGA